MADDDLHWLVIQQYVPRDLIHDDFELEKCSEEYESTLCSLLGQDKILSLPNRMIQLHPMQNHALEAQNHASRHSRVYRTQFGQGKFNKVSRHEFDIRENKPGIYAIEYNFISDII